MDSKARRGTGPCHKIVRSILNDENLGHAAARRATSTLYDRANDIITIRISADISVVWIR
jgi:hypothetical protein